VKKSLYKKSLVIGIIVLFAVASVIPSMGSTIVERHASQDNFMNFNPRYNILFVGGIGPNNYTSIQDAIDNASCGDTVFVYDDSSPYNENVVVDKTIDLIGEDRNSTVIDGNWNGDIINISANGVNISSFTIQNSGDIPLANAGIWFDGVNNCTVKKTMFYQCYIGIATYYVNNNIISDCFFDNCFIGVYSLGVAASFYDDFSTDTGMWTYYGSATMTGGYLELTPNEDGQCGQIWFEETIIKNFIVEFDYQIGGLGGGGADGLVCMFYKQTGYTPEGGGSLGFVDITGNVPGYGIELDHWYNSGDPSYEHIALIKDSVSNHLAWMNDDRVDDDIWHHVKTIVDTNDIYVFVDDMENPLFIWNGVIDRSFGGFGFTAATGGANAYHRIDDVQMSYGCQISNGSQFNDNTIVNSVTGFYMESSGGNLITNNKIVNNYAGISLFDSNSNSFYNNNISQNRYGMGLSHSINNTIVNNIVKHNLDDGIYLLNYSHNNIITNNSIALNNDNGIYFQTSNNNTINENSITSNDDNGIELYYSSNNCIKDNTISLNYWKGIAIIQSINNTLINNTVSMNKFDGLYLEDSNINNIIGNTVTANNENGMNLEDTIYNIIKGNTISKNKEGIYIDDSVRNIITGNNITSNKNDGIELSQSSSHTITSNNITENNNNGIYLYDCNSNHIIDNNISSNKNDGIKLYQSCNNIITNNNLTVNNNNGIYIGDSSSNTVSNNTISSNDWYGIYLKDSTDNKMRSNNITNNYEGILLWNSSYNNIITSNSITLNSYNGIYFHTSYSNTIDNNNIKKNGGGIELHYSSGNRIGGNTIISNYWDGIYLRNSYGNTITDNNIMNNDDGIYLYGSSSNSIVSNNIINNGYWYSGGGIYLDYSSINNIIYHNNFINEESNAVDNGNNTWDDGEYGNYWGDYEERYPNALKIQHKGIWSIHYEIPGGTNKDTCPLLKEWPKSKSKDYIEKHNNQHKSITLKSRLQYPNLTQIFKQSMQI